MRDAPWGYGVASWFDVGWIAGLALWGCAILGFRRRVRSSARLMECDLRSLIRQQSREIYLALYVTLGLRLAMGMITSIATHRAFDASNSMTPMQPLLACGLLGLLMIRWMALAVRVPPR